MCSTCGCSQPANAVKIHKVNPGDLQLAEHQAAHHGFGTLHLNEHHLHDHGHHEHHHHTGEKTVIQLELDILGKNNLLAERNRGYFEAKNIAAFNLVSSPGSGKTALLERTLNDLKGQLPFFVIEGDQQTNNDADRIAATGAPVVQINTGKGCHLDADMIHQAIKQLAPTDHAVVFIENVGNLVCPALFDLGESARVVIISVTEGDDKPLKYPDMFHSSQLCIINKTDLLPYVPFDVEKVKANARKVSHLTEFIELSAYTGQGMEQWYDWLKKHLVH